MKANLLAFFLVAGFSLAAFAWDVRNYELNGPGAPFDLCHGYPYSIVSYDINAYYQVPPGGVVDQVLVESNGKPHHLRYNEGYWYDYNSGSSFPARQYTGTLPSMKGVTIVVP